MGEEVGPRPSSITARVARIRERMRIGVPADTPIVDAPLFLSTCQQQKQSSGLENDCVDVSNGSDKLMPPHYVQFSQNVYSEEELAFRGSKFWRKWDDRGNDRSYHDDDDRDSRDRNDRDRDSRDRNSRDRNDRDRNSRDRNSRDRDDRDRNSRDRDDRDRNSRDRDDRDRNSRDRDDRDRDSRGWDDRDSRRTEDEEGQDRNTWKKAR